MSAQKPVDVEALRMHSEAPWELVEVRNTDAVYGDGGPDDRRGFDAFRVVDAAGRVLFDSLNSTASVIDEHYDDEYGSVDAWDEIARRNLSLAAVAPLLLAEIIERRARDAAVERLIAADVAYDLADAAYDEACRKEAEDDSFSALDARHALDAARELRGAALAAVRGAAPR